MIINGRELLKAAPIKDMLTRKVRHNGVSHGLAEVGYDIRLKQTVHFKPMGPTVTRRSAKGVLEETKLGRFILASTVEEFDMPASLTGIVHDKSTWARLGLSVFNTVIEPGWKGFLTLELVYHGGDELVIEAGSGIAQVIFHRPSCLAAYSGKYQNQEDRPVADIRC